MSKKTIYLIIGIVFLISLGIYGIIKFAIAFAPGSYPYAEIYTLNYPENKVQEIIKVIKVKNKNLLPTDSTLIDDSIRNNHWIRNYYNLNDRTILTWTRPKSDNETNLAFVGISDSLTHSNWKDINRDLKKEENKRLKIEFETIILEKIKTELEKK